MVPKVIRFDVSAEDLKTTREECRQKLSPQTFAIINKIIVTLVFVLDALEQKKLTILQLCKIIFGSKSEKTKDVLKKAGQTQAEAQAPTDTAQSDSALLPASGSPVQTPTSSGQTTISPVQGPAPVTKAKGHGRHGVEDYPNAQRVVVPHPNLKDKDPCPECPKGKLYPLEPIKIIRIIGQAPLMSLLYALERLRCSLCGKIFTASAPAEMGPEKYDSSAAAIIGLTKYGSGMPFFRLERLQEALETPLPCSTQWKIVGPLGERAEPVYEELKKQAADGQVLFNDDTPNRILEESKEMEEEEARGNPPERTGIFTSGIVGLVGEHRIVLYFTGRKHAGENLADLLAQRQVMAIPLQMCDGLSRNEPKGFQTLMGNCLAHGRRKFVVLVDMYPDEVQVLLESLGLVYFNDERARVLGMNQEERLRFHQEYSGPVMAGLKSWMEGLFSEKKVEPNSNLGKAIQYMLKRWEKMTLFLRHAGAPLDNNLCERVLKLVVLNRKNALFFKTRNGAHVGDILTSLIATCYQEGVNPFEYLKALYDHAEEVKEAPARWIPWNYKEALA
jgi:hypothetical protein